MDKAINKLEKEFAVLLNITTLTDLEKGVLADKFTGSLRVVEEKAYLKGYVEGKRCRR